MAKIVSTRIQDGEVVREEHEIGDMPFTCVVHQQGMKVDVPEFVEVNPQDTLRTLDEMNQAQWEWITEGDIFKTLWSEAFDPQDRHPVPKSLQIFNLMDTGERHVAGMIIMGCEACMAGRSVFFRNPETYLHPRTERTIVGMLRKMMEICGKSGVVTDQDGNEQVVKAVIPDENIVDDTAQCFDWLTKLMETYGDKKEIVQLPDGTRVTVGVMMDEVMNRTDRGQWFVGEYVKLRDG